MVVRAGGERAGLQGPSRQFLELVDDSQVREMHATLSADVLAIHDD